MTTRHLARIVVACATLLGAMTLAHAQDAITAPAQKTVGGASTKMIPSLAVLNAGGATLADGRLTLSSVGANTIVFADRPYRAAGHVPTSDFIAQWDEGKDSFAKDPPNATISVMSSDGKSIEDAVVVLRSPRITDGNLSFEVSVLEGELSGSTGPAALFIDWFAARGAYGGVAIGGAFHAPVWRGGWYAHPGAAYGAGLAAGAAIGAAAAYGHPYCGYYPHPPCY